MMLRAELLKASTATSTTVTVLVGTIGLLLTQLSFVFLIPVLASGRFAAELGSDLDLGIGAGDPNSSSYQLNALNIFGSNEAGSVGLSMIAVLVLGLLIATTDFRFGGIVSSALAEPNRGKILLAKLGATTIGAVGLSLAYAVICAIVLAISLATTPGAGFTLSAGEILESLSRGILGMTLLAWMGLALGIIVRGQLTGFIVLISLIVFEPMLIGITQLVTGATQMWTRFLPATLAQNGLASSGAANGLDPLLAAVTLLGIAVAALTVAWAAFSRRDV